jgi:hypothetical protein
MTNTQKKLEKLTQTFIKEAAPLFYEQAVEQATEEITKGFAGFAKAGFKVTNGNGHHKVKAKPGPKPKTRTKGGKRKTKKGAKRTKAQLVEMQVKIFDAIHKSGKTGIGSSDIQEATGFTAQDMLVPIKKLLVAKKLRKTGERNATVYFTRKGATAPTTEA